MRLRVLTVTTVLLATAGTSAGVESSVSADAAGSARPMIGSCPAFPTTNAFNRNISKVAVDPRSATWLRSIGAGHLHADFGGHGAYGIPYRVVGPKTRLVPVRVDHRNGYPDESNLGPAPIPLSTRVERGGDAHVLVVRAGECKLYELYGARRSGAGWVALQKSVFNLRSNKLRPDGWTSADAAGLPILPGLVRYDEVASGHIDHAIRFTVPRVRKAWIHPATHYGTTTSAAYPAYGQRFRLKASFSLKRFHGESLVILRALKTYGLIVADQGSGWFLSGAVDKRWNDNDLNQLKTVPSSAFQAIRSGRIHLYKG